ncbi:MAG: 3'-5' exonuclease [Ruminococcus sp.]|nr:3'-5' exonuclease [Ruminococcus sp.]
MVKNMGKINTVRPPGYKKRKITSEADTRPKINTVRPPGYKKKKILPAVTKRMVISKYEKCDAFVQDYIIFDLETTGFTPENCQIIEIGAIKFSNGKEMSRFHEYVKISGSVPKKITKLTGITDEMLSDGKDIKTILENFKEYIGNSVLIAHNVSFDMRFLQSFYYTELGYCLVNKVLDTLPLARRYMTELENHKLITIKQYFQLDIDSHNALDDCYVTYILYQHILKKSN